MSAQRHWANDVTRCAFRPAVGKRERYLYVCDKAVRALPISKQEDGIINASSPLVLDRPLLGIPPSQRVGTDLEVWPPAALVSKRPGDHTTVVLGSLKHVEEAMKELLPVGLAGDALWSAILGPSPTEPRLVTSQKRDGDVLNEAMCFDVRFVNHVQPMFITEFVPSGMMGIVTVSHCIEIPLLPGPRSSERTCWLTLRGRSSCCAAKAQHLNVSQHVLLVDCLTPSRMHFMHVGTGHHDGAIVHPKLSLDDGNGASAPFASMSRHPRDYTRQDDSCSSCLPQSGNIEEKSSHGFAGKAAEADLHMLHLNGRARSLCKFELQQVQEGILPGSGEIANLVVIALC